jgi:hypothetical protein
MTAHQQVASQSPYRHPLDNHHPLYRPWAWQTASATDHEGNSQLHCRTPRAVTVV